MNKNLCSIENCNQKSVSKGYCKRHYWNYWKYGNPLARKETPKKSCKINDCTEQHHAKGYCKNHYNHIIGLKKGENYNAKL